MAEDTDAAQQDVRPPRWVRLFDDVFLLLAAGLIVPTFFYIVLGLYSLLSVPEFAP